MHAALTIIFWSCLGVVFCAYAVYPIVIGILAWRFGAGHGAAEIADENLPSVTLLIAAHNEEKVIEWRLQNALALDYPAGKLRIVVASDASTDATCGIVRSHVRAGVKLLDYAIRRGKAGTLNAAMCGIDSDVVVFSDANTSMRPEALRKLVRWLADPSVGGVCGRLVLTDSAASTNADGGYWNYETFLKTCESRLGVLLGCNGAIYALRRSCFAAIPDDTILDDMMIPLLARLRSGCRLVYDAQATAYEPTAAGIGGEFARRARIAAGIGQVVKLLSPLLSPRRPMFALAFFSHKLLRWLSPFLLAAALISSACLCGQPFYRWALAAQLALYATPLLDLRLRFWRAAQMFTLMNLALMVGICRTLVGSASPIWEPTSSISPPASAEPTRIAA